MVVISVSLSAQELKEFEKVASQAGFSSRSDAVRDALARFVSDNNWANDMEGKVSCALSIVYSDRKKLHVHEIVHQYSDIVHSSMHTHLGQRCVEQIVLDGDGEEVRKLLSELLGHKDVRITMAIF